MIDDYEQITAQTDKLIELLTGMGLNDYVQEIMHSYSLLANNYYNFVEGDNDYDCLDFGDDNYKINMYAEKYTNSYKAHKLKMREIFIVSRILGNVKTG
jgi:Trk K+ transport system NAD-binding subunit